MNYYEDELHELKDELNYYKDRRNHMGDNLRAMQIKRIESRLLQSSFQSGLMKYYRRNNV